MYGVSEKSGLTVKIWNKLIEYIRSSKAGIVFFGGAGVSTESGIRISEQRTDLYNQKDIQFEEYSPEYLLSQSVCTIIPRYFFLLSSENGYQKYTAKHYTKCLPSGGCGKLSAIVTQNIDGLHQKAGSKNVLEIHGTTQRCYRTKCHEYNGSYIFESGETIPRKCPSAAVH